jgi:hypothetical protein
VRATLFAESPSHGMTPEAGSGNQRTEALFTIDL